MPEELAKFVLSIPISAAFSFIISTKFSSVPAIPSAKATQASLPETIIMPFNNSSTVTESFTIINIDEYPLWDSLQAFLETINSSDKDIFSFLSKSNTTIVVIIFVIEAG